MCGIFGYFGRQKEFEINRMEVLRQLRHRGPDGEGWVELRSGALGHTRLAIMDLSERAQQPMQDASRRFTLVFNGEIYNYKELRLELEKDGREFRTNSDTEVILQGFLHWGDAVFSRLQGMFALAIHDQETDLVTLARDRLGIKPLVHHSSEGGFAFASELKALISLHAVPKKIDSVALTSLLKFGAVTQPLTLFKDVFQLEPGHVLRLSANGSIRVYPFCDKWLSEEGTLDGSYEKAVDQLRGHLEVATADHLLADVEVGCFLSGGIDSSAVLALMQRKVEKPIKAFSLGFPSTLGVDDESGVAERTAKVLGSEFHRVTLTDEQILPAFLDFINGIDQPSIDGFNTYLVSAAAANHVKVVLSGLGGDELFGGYPHFALIAAALKQKPKPWDGLYKFIHRVKPTRVTQQANLRGRNPIEALGQFRQVFSDKEIGNMLVHAEFMPNLNLSASKLSPLQNVTFAESTGYLLNTLLRDSDSVSMWHGLEIRPVLLAQSVVEFAQKLPDDFKVRAGRSKSIFIDAVSTLIPDEVINRRKTGFGLPLEVWMNGVLRESILATLKTDISRTTFQPNFLRSLTTIAEQRALKNRHWLIIVLLSWLQTLRS
jgi:asparagine synthase (glutamine-hydrolysing)